MLQINKGFYFLDNVYDLLESENPYPANHTTATDHR